MEKSRRVGALGPVTGVMFDLGGTLCSYEAREQMGQANGAALLRLGFDPAAPEVRAARRAASEEVQRVYATRRSFRHTDFFRDRLARTAELLGAAAPAAVLDQFDVENVRNIIEHMPPRRDAADTLQGLVERGLYRAVVSNADDTWLGPVLERHGLADLVVHWTSSEEAGSCKPDTAIYECALTKAERTAAEVLFVGDSLQHDIAGANAVGMRSVLIVNEGATTPLAHGLEATATPDFEIHQLGDVLGMVDEINRNR